MKRLWNSRTANLRNKFGSEAMKIVLKGACEIEFEQFLMSAVMSFALVSFFCMTCLWVLSAETIVIYFVVV